MLDILHRIWYLVKWLLKDRANGDGKSGRLKLVAENVRTAMTRQEFALSELQVRVNGKVSGSCWKQ